MARNTVDRSWICPDMSNARKQREPELHPDAWARFERAVDVVAKSPPQHRVKPKTSPARKKKTPLKRG
jgi:hypothetical protein